MDRLVVVKSEAKDDDEEVVQLIGSSVGFKIGQKYPTPSPGNGDRVFYETLLSQKPDSEMAQEWCLNYGVLDAEKAATLYKMIMKRKGKAAVFGDSESKASKSNMKSSSNSNVDSGKKSAKPKPSTSSSRRKRAIEDNCDDEDLSRGWEGQSSSSI